MAEAQEELQSNPVPSRIAKMVKNNWKSTAEQMLADEKAKETAAAAAAARGGADAESSNFYLSCHRSAMCVQATHPPTLSADAFTHAICDHCWPMATLRYHFWPILAVSHSCQLSVLPYWFSMYYCQRLLVVCHCS